MLSIRAFGRGVTERFSGLGPQISGRILIPGF